MNKLIYWPALFWLSGKRLFQEQYTYRASGLAFATLLAIVPLLSVILSIIAIFPIFSNFVTLSQNYIFSNFLPTSGNLIQKYLLNFINQATHLPTVGIIFLLFTAIALIIMVEHTLNFIWDTHKHKRKWFNMLIYWLVLLCMPLLIGVSVALSTYVFSITWIAGTAKTLGLITILPLVINTFIFSALYIVVPNCKVKFRDGIFGGLIAAILFEAAKKGFAFYLKHFPSYELIYGTLATIPIFLLWVYISWLIVLYGALVTHTRHVLRKRSVTGLPEK